MSIQRNLVLCPQTLTPHLLCLKSYYGAKVRDLLLWGEVRAFVGLIFCDIDGVALVISSPASFLCTPGFSCHVPEMFLEISSILRLLHTIKPLPLMIRPSLYLHCPVPFFTHLVNSYSSFKAS